MHTATDRFIAFIENLTTRPGMYVAEADYDFVTTYLCGYDHAFEGAVLAGFHEWLTMRIGRGHDLTWPRLFKYEVARHDASIAGSERTKDEDLLAQLRGLLIEYMRYRAQIGLRNVYYDHGAWVRKVDWFNEHVERYGSSDCPRKTEQDAPPDRGGDLNCPEIIIHPPPRQVTFYVRQRSLPHGDS